AGEERKVALWTEMKHALRQSCFDNAVGDVTGTRNRVVRSVRHGKTIEDASDVRARARRVGDQDDRAAPAAKARKRIAGLREGGDAVVHDAPDVAQQDVIVARERTKLFHRGNLDGTQNQQTTEP